jgi:hypothetical protein
MQELLQEIDVDYYRAARLLIVRAELEQLRLERAALADVERRSQIPLATPPQATQVSKLVRPSPVHSVGTDAAFFLAFPR